MPDRHPSAHAAHAARVLTLAVEVALFTPRGGELAVLVAPARAEHGRGRDRWTLPFDGPRGDESLDDTAARVARDVLGSAPSHLGQAATMGGAKRASEGAQVRVVYFALAPDAGDAAAHRAEWRSVSHLDGVAGRDRSAIEAGLAALRAQVDEHPIAFRLLPPAFTLSELQSVYELLLGRRLHKASFRRSLHAAALVEATEEWRSEGRGRPAQLFRYAPPRRRQQRRGVRLDLLSSSP